MCLSEALLSWFLEPFAMLFVISQHGITIQLMTLGIHLALLLSSCVTLGKSLTCSLSHFLILKMGKQPTCFLGLLWGPFVQSKSIYNCAGKSCTTNHYNHHHSWDFHLKGSCENNSLNTQPPHAVLGKDQESIPGVRAERSLSGPRQWAGLRGRAPASWGPGRWGQERRQDSQRRSIGVTARGRLPPGRDTGSSLTPYLPPLQVARSISSLTGW